MAEITESGQSKTFNYTGGIQSINLDKGFYKLEVWGCTCGEYPNFSTAINNAMHSNVGYSKGIIHLDKNTTLYVVCGGKPYNGGGVCDNGYGAGGRHAGGATHIAFESGLLSSFNNKRDKVIIVAGGGGGCSGMSGNGYPKGGSGGGETGGYVSGYNGSPSHAGTQTSGYAFGQGQGSGIYCTGGGGWYGGYGGGNYWTETAVAGGGSGYINTNLLFDAITEKDHAPQWGSAKITNVDIQIKTDMYFCIENPKDKYDIGDSVTIRQLVNTDREVITTNNVAIQKVSKNLYEFTIDKYYSLIDIKVDGTFTMPSYINNSNIYKNYKSYLESIEWYKNE